MLCVLIRVKKLVHPARITANEAGLMVKNESLVVVGIDLAGSPKRPTGLCVLRDLTAETRVAFSDDEIIEFVTAARPALVPIDAPLSLPKGRRSVHDRSGEHLRECDRELLRRGIRFFPVTLGPMRMLTERGLALKKRLIEMGYQTVECYPGAAQDLLGNSSTTQGPAGSPERPEETQPAWPEESSDER